MWTTCSIVDCSSKDFTTTDLPDFDTTITLSQSGMKNMGKKNILLYKKRGNISFVLSIFLQRVSQPQMAEEDVE